MGDTRAYSNCPGRKWKSPSSTTPDTQQQAQNDVNGLEQQELTAEWSPHSLQLAEPEIEQLTTSMIEGAEGEGAGEMGEFKELGEDGE